MRLDPKYTTSALVRGLRVIPAQESERERKKGESKTQVRNLLTSRNGMVPLFLPLSLSFSFLLSFFFFSPRRWSPSVLSFIHRTPYTMTRLGFEKDPLPFTRSFCSIFFYCPVPAVTPRKKKKEEEEK